MFTFNNRSVGFKRNGVKYVAKFTNIDKKYGFKRDFVNGFEVPAYDNKFILEICTTDNVKTHYIIDSKLKTFTEVKYDEIKKMSKNVIEFYEEYFR